MNIAYISKKDLVTRFKCFIFQHHGMAPSHSPSLRHRCRGDGWFDAIYPCSQEIMFPSLRCRQVQSWIMCLAFLEPQPPLVLVHSFPIPALTCPPGGKLPHHLFPSLSHTSKLKETPQPHPLSLVRLLPSISSAPPPQQDVLLSPQLRRYPSQPALSLTRHSFRSEPAQGLCWAAAFSDGQGHVWKELIWSILVEKAWRNKVLMMRSL